MMEEYTPNGKDYFEWLKEWCKSIYVKIWLIGFPFMFALQEWGVVAKLSERMRSIYDVAVFLVGLDEVITSGGTFLPTVFCISQCTDAGGDGGYKVGEATIDGVEYDLYRKSVIPYSRVEKAASQISNTMNHKIESGFPVIIAESQEANQAASALFGRSVSGALDTLDVLERVLQI